MHAISVALTLGVFAFFMFYCHFSGCLKLKTSHSTSEVHPRHGFLVVALETIRGGQLRHADSDTRVWRSLPKKRWTAAAVAAELEWGASWSSC